ncbi:DUF6941 family protein [Rhodococcus erythropolis]|uniref:DUF6941 family protein n=1 Tax=Rhodococcus erythropolis TaxID=1833 RepID=UPI00406BB481
MRIAAAFLATHVTMPEGSGILNVLDAGVTWIDRPTYPAPLDLYLALLLAATPEEYERALEMEIEIRSVDSDDVAKPGLRVAHLKGQFQPTLNSTARGDSFGALVPLVADFGAVDIPFHGHYRISISVADAEATVEFQARSDSQ